MITLGEKELLQIAEHQLLVGDLLSAKFSSHQALQLNPTSCMANILLAKIYLKMENQPLSFDYLAKATDSLDCPSYVLYEYGSICLSQGSYSKAITVLERALNQNGESFEILHDIGVALALSGKKDAALEKFNAAILINPNSAELHYNIGCIYDGRKEYLNALSHYEKALLLDPSLTFAWINLGIDQAQLRRYPEALKSLQQALTLNPNQDYIYGDILLIKMRMCDWVGIKHLKQVIYKRILIGGNAISPFGSLCITEQPAEILQIAQKYILDKFPENKILGDIQQSKSDNKIKVAYFSSDFYEHPVSFLMAEIFELHNRDKFEIYAFALAKNASDPLLRRLEKGVDYFHQVDHLSDTEVAILVRALKIDIAIDLNGHTDHMRLGIFSARCAPIQISYIGYLGSIGAAYFDYLVADPIIVTPQLEHNYSEKIIYLPNYYTRDTKTLKPNFASASRASFNLPKDKFIFCSFNNNYKITPEIFEVWMKILGATENSVLLIYAENKWSKENLISQAMLLGIEKDRIIFADYVSRSEYLLRLSVCDLFLDTFPYNAGTTANDALWMGLPLLTLSGEAFQSRVANSLLSALDLKELVTTDPAKYLETAIWLSSDPISLSGLKNKLRVNSQACDLFKPSIFTENIERAYEVIYSRSMAQLPPLSIYT